jgi:hypothetical protein
VEKVFISQGFDTALRMQFKGPHRNPYMKSEIE